MFVGFRIFKSLRKLLFLVASNKGRQEKRATSISSELAEQSFF